MIFSGDYKIILNRGNYVPLDTLDMKIKPGKELSGLRSESLSADH